jgi:hypothetical protein
MTPNSPNTPNSLAGRAIAFRSPRRISITLPYEIYLQLMQPSSLQGRSLSNLAAFLLEPSLGEGGGSRSDGRPMPLAAEVQRWRDNRAG